MFRAGFLIVVCLTGAIVVVLAQAPQYGIGRPATAEEIRKRNIFVAPDGTGLTPGKGTAIEGGAVYTAKCASCHGEHGEGTTDFPALVGGRGSLSTNKPVPTVGSYWPSVTTLWDYITGQYRIKVREASLPIKSIP